jgi:hypothetical protein
MQHSARLFVFFLLLPGLLLRAAIPTPEQQFGYRLGSDRKLADWNELVAYFDRLSKTSNRIRVAELGKTTEGRPFIMATISSPANLGKLDRYRTIQEKLSDPRGLPERPTR